MNTPNRWSGLAAAVATLVVGSLALLPAGARAYTISSPISAGCHESITTEAFRGVRKDVPNAVAMPTDRNELALINDLQFTPDADMRDLGAVSLLVGVRDNDLKGRSSTDLTQLAEVHGNPDTQMEHCLRGANQNEPGGTKTALDECRGFIRERIAQALAGLDANGKPDASLRTGLLLDLSMRKQVNASLPTYYVRIGQAIHAIEDSFTHTYRTPDEMQITVALDWLHSANGTLVEVTNGPPHAAELDRCDDPDALRTRRRELATEAAGAVLRTTLAEDTTNDQKLAEVDVILDKYLGYSPGCTFDNTWCGAPEHLFLGPSTLGCSGAGSAAPFGWALLLGLPALLRRLGRRRLARTAVIVGALAALTFPGLNAAWADEGLPPPVVVAVKEPGPRDPSNAALGLWLGGGGSFDHSALAVSLGVRLRVSRHWTFGVDGEWNPWLALTGAAVRAGVLNVYATAIARLPLAYEQFNLRITGSAGVSRLFMDLYGAPKGSIGVYVALSPLGLEWKLSRIFYLIINPLTFALPIPQLTGVPLTYPQYRTTIGLEIYTG